MRRWRLWLLGLVLLETCPTLTAINVYKEPKGADLTITCSSGKNPKVTRRVFCKNDCEEQDILVQTSGSDQTNGRYRIQHEKKGSPPQDFIDVTISNLRLNDSGRYRCLWDQPQQTSFSEFRVEVTEGLKESKAVYSVTAGEDYSHSFYFDKPGRKKSFCRNSCSEDDLLVSTTGDEAQSGRFKIQYKKYADDLSYVTVTIKNTDISDSGAYQCHLDEKYKDFWVEVSPAPPSGDPAPPGQKPTGRPAPPSGHPVTVRPSEAPTGQKPTGRPGGLPQTQNLTLILGLILVCVTIIIMATILTICLKRRARRGRGAGRPRSGAERPGTGAVGPGTGAGGPRTGAGRPRTGAVGPDDPQGGYENKRPESEGPYEALNLEDMDPAYGQLHKDPEYIQLDQDPADEQLDQDPEYVQVDQDQD